MSAPLFRMQKSVEALRDWNEEADDFDSEEHGPFLANERAIWTDGSTALWCEAGDITDVPSFGGFAPYIERAAEAPVVRRLKRKALTKTLRRGGWVVVDGHEYRAGRILAALKSVDGDVVEIAIHRGEAAALVLRAGQRGAVIVQLADPVDLLALPEAK